MTKQIDAETLREWLESQQPVTVLDIRTNEDRAQWAIPGSLHLNAYEALRAGQPGLLADAPFPRDRPVVTVCNAGRVSQTAAEMLADWGFDARSLAAVKMPNRDGFIPDARPEKFPPADKAPPPTAEGSAADQAATPTDSAE